MTLQSDDLHNREAESLPHPRPILQRCNVEAVARITAEERARYGLDDDRFPVDEYIHNAEEGLRALIERAGYAHDQSALWAMQRSIYAVIVNNLDLDGGIIAGLEEEKDAIWRQR